MKPCPWLIVILCTLSTATVAQLPVVIELDRYLVEARQLIEQEEFSEAKVWLNKAHNLDVALPPDFYYLNGKYLFSAERYKDAEISIIEYLNHTGRLGRYYNDALAVITALEKQSTALNQQNGIPRDENVEEKPVSQLDEKSVAEQTDTQEAQIEKQELALIDRIKKFTEKKSGPSAQNPYQIIQDSINKLLRENAIFERYGVDVPTLVYSVKAGYGDMLVITRSEDGMEGLQVASHNVTIKSIPEKLESECSWQEQRCWISHPLNNQRWLEINYSEEAKETLVASMEGLINTMRD